MTTTPAPDEPVPAAPAYPLADAAHSRHLRGMAGKLMLDVGGVLTAIGGMIVGKAHESAELDVAEAYQLGHRHGYQQAHADGQTPP